MEGISAFSPLLAGGAAFGAMPYMIGADLWAACGNGPVRRGPVHRHAVALTFDDGPDLVCTPQLLDILAQFGARATFFVIGKRAERHPEIIRAIADAGHEVGNHTHTHPPLWLMPPRQTRAEIDRCTSVLATILGEPPRYFRPPWGRLNRAAVEHSIQVRQLPVLWSLRGDGWSSLAKPKTIVRIVRRRLHPGAIIELHDGRGLARTPTRLIAAMPKLLRLIQGRGYRCLTLSELLSERPTPPPPATVSSRV